jgi:hypothetical protein
MQPSAVSFRLKHVPIRLDNLTEEQGDVRHIHNVRSVARPIIRQVVITHSCRGSAPEVEEIVIGVAHAIYARSASSEVALNRVLHRSMHSLRYTRPRHSPAAPERANKRLRVHFYAIDAAI